MINFSIAEYASDLKAIFLECSATSMLVFPGEFLFPQQLGLPFCGDKSMLGHTQIKSRLEIRFGI